jgi:DNA end-binding protein Ku
VRQALGDRRAMAHIVLRNRATLVALEAQPEGFLVYQLRAAEQVRTFDEVRPIQLTVVPSRADLSLARQLLDSLEGTFSYEDVTDEYTARLKDLLQAKVDGRAPAMPAAAAPNVASLAEALAQSLKLQQAKQKFPMTAKTVKATMPVAQSRKRA